MQLCEAYLRLKMDMMSVKVSSSSMTAGSTRGSEERLERLIYLSESCQVSAKFVAGRQIF